MAVLACSCSSGTLTPSLGIIINAGLTFGQPVYFLGFPFGWDSGLENMNRDLPVPFVKAGVLSAMIAGDDSHIYIDAHGNKGFSGGPVVFVPNGRSANEFRVAGVVAEAPRPRLEAVVDRFGKPILGAKMPSRYRTSRRIRASSWPLTFATRLI